MLTLVQQRTVMGKREEKKEKRIKNGIVIFEFQVVK